MTMKVILLQNTMWDGHRVKAGQEIELPKDVAEQFIATKLAYNQAEKTDESETPVGATDVAGPTGGFDTGDKKPAKKSGKKGK